MVLSSRRLKPYQHEQQPYHAEPAWIAACEELSTRLPGEYPWGGGGLPESDRCRHDAVKDRARKSRGD
jgi:hypothetical protein